ncbi:hypothetical protein BT69DRAFT_219503, partial [Atractiella rhizophila]
GETNGRSAAKGDEDKAEPQEIIEVNVSGKKVKLNEQIQLYATNEQLSNPFVSPVFQPSLGGLPPMLVIAGNNEVLRDEIVYLAHRAANPAGYPLREALRQSSSQHGELPPTKVHLQVYDDAPHVLPLFSFTTPAKYCYRSIASFCVWATSQHTFNEEATTNERISKSSTAEWKDEPTMSTATNSSTSKAVTLEKSRSTSRKERFSAVLDLHRHSHMFSKELASSPSQLSARTEETEGSNYVQHPQSKPESNPFRKLPSDLEQTIYSAQLPMNRPDFKDNMIRERVSIKGVIRPLENTSQIRCLNLDPEDIGIIKEGPVRRYLDGKKDWDQKYRRVYLRIQRKREHNVKRATREELERIKARLKNLRHGSFSSSNQDQGQNMESEDFEIEFGGATAREAPPPSSIAA